MSDGHDHFTGLADFYAQARPDYAVAAIDYLSRLVPDTVTARVADVGAGTGKLTAMLAPRFASVWAIEPNDDMRRRAREELEAYGNVQVVEGTAEATTLPNHSVDLVVCAQAFHWFDPAGFRHESARIAGAQAPVAIVYNTGMGVDKHEELSWWEPSHASPTWVRRVEAIREFFGGYVACAEFPHPLHYDAENYLAFMLSHSTTPRPDNLAYLRYIESVKAIFARESVDGILTLDYSTCVYTSSRYRRGT